jgi:1-acyl-sn-glycerol-3-phosphate acyltransferase
MGNHQGNFDIFALFQAVPIRFLWLAKEELFRVPVFGWSMRRAGYIPLNRGHGTKALKSLEFASAAICQGTNLIIFPEGTRSNDGSLLPFKKGGFLLAINARVPVVPFTINGSHQINPRNQLKLCPGEISIDFGEPIETAGLNPVQYPTLAETARNAIGHNLKP